MGHLSRELEHDSELETPQFLWERLWERNIIPTLPSVRVLTGIKEVNGVVDTIHVAAEKKSMNLSA